MKKFKLLQIFIVSAVLFSLVSCSGIFFDKDSKEFSNDSEFLYMMYLAGDTSISNLGRALQKNINDLISGLKNSSLALNERNVNVIVFADFTGKSKLFCANYPYFALTDISEEADFIQDDCNSGDILTLGKFLKFANERFSAEKKILTIGSHGSGIFGTKEGDENPFETSLSYRSICPDNDSSSSKNMMWILESQLPYAFDYAGFKDSEKLDLLHLDLCLEGGIEVAYELKKNVKYFLASPEEIPAEGFPYSKMEPLFARGTSIEDFGISCVEIYANQNYYSSGWYNTLTFASLDESYMDELKKSVNALSDYLSNLTNEYLEYIKSNFFGVSKLAYYPGKYIRYNGNYAFMYDFGFFIEKLKEYAESNANSQLQNLCSKVLSSLEKIIIRSWRGKIHGSSENLYDDFSGNYYGLSIAVKAVPVKVSNSVNKYLSEYLKKEGANSGYYLLNPYYSSEFSFKNDTSWKNFLSVLYPEDF
ncbi:MAG: clostripain-related cysteine peptidase [Spirochaetia bacterium]|nr:clostripain-related cysteine peptidase [Spirochaetia bacterium]